MQTFEYGAMSSMYSLQAENKLTAYVAMCMHYRRSAHLIAIYSPEECKQDTWLNITGQISDRLDEVFGGPGSFDAYVVANKAAIDAAYQSIKEIV